MILIAHVIMNQGGSLAARVRNIRSSSPVQLNAAFAQRWCSWTSNSHPVGMHSYLIEQKPYLRSLPVSRAHKQWIVSLLISCMGHF